jgi:hypothetical protein
MQEVAARQRSWLCWWRGAAPPKVGAVEAAAAGAAEAAAVALDLGQAFLHAFVIPNYKARARGAPGLPRRAGQACERVEQRRKQPA